MAVYRIVFAIALVVSAQAFIASPVHAGQIERACSISPRASGNVRLCTCIQRVADQLLTRSDQRLAASFFKDPHRAQEVRMSDRRNDERFWQRYRQFGAVAQQSCS